MKVISPPLKVKKRLQIEDENVLYLRFLKLANGKAIVYERKYMLYNKEEPTMLSRQELQELTFSELVLREGVYVPIRGSVTIMATTIKREESELLKAKEGSPAFCIEQTLYSAGEKPVAWGVYIYRGDEYKFTSTFEY